MVIDQDEERMIMPNEQFFSYQGYIMARTTYIWSENVTLFVLDPDT